MIAEKLREDRRRRYRYCASLDQQNFRLHLSRSVLVWSEPGWSLCTQEKHNVTNTCYQNDNVQITKKKREHNRIISTFTVQLFV